MALNIYSYIEAEQEKLEKSLNSHKCEGKSSEEDSEYLDYLKTLKLEFDNGKTPDYENPDVQNFYLLRYGFGYPYRYKCMYEKVLERDSERFKDNGNKIEICSLGCGARLDYLGLQYALQDTQNEEISVLYLGIEPVNWEDAVACRSQSDDGVSTVQEYAEYFLDSPFIELTSDVIIFPTSISEIPISDTKDMGNKEFEKFCTKLTQKIRKDDIYIMTTIREKVGISESDLARVEVIKKVMKENGFELKEEISEEEEEKESSKKITFLSSNNKEIYYPGDVKKYIQGLCASCEALKEQLPLEYKAGTCYRVLHFVRAK